jgi:hypothetical protein
VFTVSDFINNLVKAHLDGDLECGPLDPESKKALPRLYDGMTVRELPNRYLREPWAVSVSAASGSWSATIRDQNTRYFITAHSETLEGIWKALEGELAAVPSRWEPMKGQKQPQLRKKRDPRA